MNVILNELAQTQYLRALGGAANVTHICDVAESLEANLAFGPWVCLKHGTAYECRRQLVFDSYEISLRGSEIWSDVVGPPTNSEKTQQRKVRPSQLYGYPCRCGGIAVCAQTDRVCVDVACCPAGGVAQKRLYEAWYRNECCSKNPGLP